MKYTNAKTYTMEDEISVAEFEPTKGHSDPTLDVRRQKKRRTPFDNHFEIRVQEFEHQIEIRLR